MKGVKAALNAAGKTEAQYSSFEAGQQSYAETIDAVTASGADLACALNHAVHVPALQPRHLKAANPHAIMISADPTGAARCTRLADRDRGNRAQRDLAPHVRGDRSPSEDGPRTRRA